MINAQGASHPIFVLQVNNLQVRHGTTQGPISLRGTVLDMAGPPGWTPTAVMLSMFAGEAEPWVLCPVAAVEELIRRNTDERLASASFGLLGSGETDAEVVDGEVMGE